MPSAGMRRREDSLRGRPALHPAAQAGPPARAPPAGLARLGRGEQHGLERKSEDAAAAGRAAGGNSHILFPKLVTRFSSSQDA